MIEYRNEVLVHFESQNEGSARMIDCLVLQVSPIRDWDQSVFVAKLEFWKDGDIRRTIGEAKFMLRLSSRSTEELTDLLKGRSHIPMRELGDRTEVAVWFVGDRRRYRMLRELLPPDVLLEMLLRSGELAALNSYRATSQMLSRVRRHRYFSSLIASDEERFAFLSLRKLLSEGPRRFPYEVTAIDADLRLAPRQILPVHFRFEESIGSVQPLTAVIGPNGVGKTRLLLALARAALRFRHAHMELTGTKGVVPHHTLPVVSFTYERSQWRGLSNAGARVISMGVTSSNWRMLSTVIHQLALASHSEFNLSSLLVVFAGVIDPSELLLPTFGRTSSDAGLEQPAVRLTSLAEANVQTLAALDPTRAAFMYSERVGRYHLSSGQKSVVLFIAHLDLETAEGALVLIDEPENHLHPKFVSILMQALHRTLTATESRGIVVTHSPYVVRELDKSAVSVVDLLDGAPAIYRTSLQTLGASIALISDYVFRDREVRKGFQGRIDQLLQSAAEDPEKIKNVVEQVIQGAGGDAERYLQSQMDRIAHDHEN